MPCIETPKCWPKSVGMSKRHGTVQPGAWPSAHTCQQQPQACVCPLRPLGANTSGKTRLTPMGPMAAVWFWGTAVWFWGKCRKFQKCVWVATSTCMWLHVVAINIFGCIYWPVACFLHIFNKFNKFIISCNGNGIWHFQAHGPKARTCFWVLFWGGISSPKHTL